MVPGAQFTVNGRTGCDLAALPIASGDAVTMIWPAFAPGCESLGIGLSVKISQSTSFNENDNQYLQSFSYCGPEGPTCTTPASISIQVPSAALVPCFQLDADIGPPLALVGPAGVYYGSGLAPHDNMLISAFNGGAEPWRGAAVHDRPCRPRCRRAVHRAGDDDGAVHVDCLAHARHPRPRRPRQHGGAGRLRGGVRRLRLRHRDGDGGLGLGVGVGDGRYVVV